MGNILYRRAAGSCRIETRFHNGGRLFDRLRRRILHLRKGIEEILFRHRKVIVDVQFVRVSYVRLHLSSQLLSVFLHLLF